MSWLVFKYLLNTFQYCDLSHCAIWQLRRIDIWGFSDTVQSYHRQFHSGNKKQTIPPSRKNLPYIM